MKKTTLIILTSVFYVAAFAQAKNTNIVKKPSEPEVKVLSVKAIMDENIKKAYKIKIYNGSNKTIVAIKLRMNFTEFRPYNSKPDENKDCIKNQKFKIIIRGISSSTVKVDGLENFPCQGLPSVAITTVVFLGGTFIELRDDR